MKAQYFLALVLPAVPALILSLSSCRPMPDFQDKPFITLQFDTIVRFPGQFLPGDSVEFLAGWSSFTAANTLETGMFRENDQPLRYSGPDPVPDIRRSHALSGKNGLSFRDGFRIPASSLPGLYRFFARIRNAEGRVSDSACFHLTLRNPDYPGLVADTPAAGFSGPGLVARNFRIQLRAVGSRMDRLQLQWFDSLKTTQTGDPITWSPVPETGVAVFNRDISLPPTGGRQFFLGAGIRTRDQRETFYWMEFRRQP